MDLITALDEAIESVIQCAWAVEESAGTAVASERFERVTKECTAQAVQRLKRKRGEEKERECEEKTERRECEEKTVSFEIPEPGPPSGTD